MLFMVGTTLTGLLEHMFKKLSEAKSYQSLRVNRESLQTQKRSQILVIEFPQNILPSAK